MVTEAAVPKDAPVMVAWKAYKVTEEYANTLRWAPTHADGSLWAAFYKGFFACAVNNASAAAPPPPVPDREAIAPEPIDAGLRERAAQEIVGDAAYRRRYSTSAKAWSDALAKADAILTLLTGRQTMGEATVETLHGRDASMYQTRVKCERFRIHIFWRGDRDPDMHDHPADFWTFPLVSYVEEIPHPTFGGMTEWRLVRAFRLHHRKAEFRHLVLGAWSGERFQDGTPIPVQKPIVTLGWWAPKRRDWGFHTEAGWVPWRKYVNEPGWSPTP